jgi:Domain of unknown function (DUF6457)
MTRDEWIAAFARETGVPAPSVEEIRELLELAGTAAHSSERTAAPLACWIAGRSSLSLAELRAAAESVAGGAGAGGPEPPSS